MTPVLLYAVEAVLLIFTLFAAWRARRAEANLRWTQAAAAAATALALVTLLLGLPLAVAKYAGIGLTLVCMANVLLEKGWSRAGALAHFALAMTLAEGEALEALG